MQPSMYEVSFLIHNGLFIQSITNENKFMFLNKKKSLCFKSIIPSDAKTSPIPRRM